MIESIYPALIVALLCEAVLGAALIWSILFPKRRLWPLRRESTLSFLMVWLIPLAVFVCAFIAGIAEWSMMGWPVLLQWGVGVSLILLGTVIVWLAVFNIGLKATSGVEAELKSEGVYRWSRNPQYVAYMSILLGWAILSGSSAAWVIGVVGVALFAVAPFAEEPWMKGVYGEAYQAYKARTPRFIGIPRDRGVS